MNSMQLGQAFVIQFLYGMNHTRAPHWRAFQRLIYQCEWGHDQVGKRQTADRKGFGRPIGVHLLVQGSASIDDTDEKLLYEM